MIALVSLLLSLPPSLTGGVHWTIPAADTVRLEVGSPEVDGRIFPVHRARNRVYRGDATTPVTTWTNELALGDSAGIPVMRWTTRGEQLAPQAGGATWELLQTYDARTLAPLSYSYSSSAGASTRLTFDGPRISGEVRQPGDSAPRQVEYVLDQAAFIASASDLIPLAVGLSPGAVMTAPVWGPAMAAPEVRIFTVLGEQWVRAEGSAVYAWTVEERVEATGTLVATWFLVEESPYMVYAEVVLPDGQLQRITGVSLD